MSERPPFEAWPKIPRLRRTVIITEKLDGTNAHILVTPDGDVYAASRNRYVEPGNDNYGFAQWVQGNRQDLLDLLGPGRHYGEWWGAGIQRGYGLRERRFSLFNTSRWKPTVDRAPWSAAALADDLLIHPCGVYVVPTIAISEDHNTIEDALSSLLSAGSVAAPGYPMPEGIVVYHTAAGQMFKVLLENDNVPKGQVKE